MDTAAPNKPRITPPPPIQLVLPASAYREENQIYWDKRRSAEAAAAYMAASVAPYAI
jgi:hypothetical protein